MAGDERRTRAARKWRSFTAKLSLLAVIFLTVPVVIYVEFQAADAEKGDLVLRTVQRDGRLIAEGLDPFLRNFRAESASDLLAALERLASGDVGVKLLFRPRSLHEPQDFVYVAAVPPVPEGALDAEQVALLESGVLDDLHHSCMVGTSLAERYASPIGDDEVLTSITPVLIPAGCWAVITAHSARDILGPALGEPFWRVPEVQVALVIYTFMAAVVLSLVVGLWRNLRRFAGLARDIRGGASPSMSFASMNSVPELDPVAREFDALVSDLRASAVRIQQAAEENAHAFKTPLAVIAQATEPLRRLSESRDGTMAPEQAARLHRAVDTIERATGRLDALVSAARELDRASVELMASVFRATDLSAIGRKMADAMAADWQERGLRLAGDVAPDIVVMADDDMIETIVENLLSNAADFSPPSGEVSLRIYRESEYGVIEVEDSGPGVPESDLDRIFQRYVSQRLGPGNFGIGLWIVRRNAEAAGGTAVAANRPTGGLRVTVRLLLVAHRRNGEG